MLPSSDNILLRLNNLSTTTLLEASRSGKEYVTISSTDVGSVAGADDAR